MRRLPTLRIPWRALAIAGLLAATVAGGSLALSAAKQAAGPDYLFNDSHFHLTNYVQKGTDIHKYVEEIMGDKVGRSTLFGIPLQQMWSYANSGDFAPTYYLQSDAPLYYYSFTDAYIARVYQSLPKAQQARLDPMITARPTSPAKSRIRSSAGLVRLAVSPAILADTNSLWIENSPMPLKTPGKSSSTRRM